MNYNSKQRSLEANMFDDGGPELLAGFVLLYTGALNFCL